MAHLTLSQHDAAQGNPGLAAAPKVRLTLLRRIFGVWRQRQHLNRLGAHLRRDIGVTDAQVEAEVARPVWDVPTTWRL